MEAADEATHFHPVDSCFRLREGVGSEVAHA